VEIPASEFVSVNTVLYFVFLAITLFLSLIFKRSFCKSANWRVQVDMYLQKVYFILGNAGWRAQRCSFIYSNPDVILAMIFTRYLYPEMSSTDELVHSKRTMKYISRGYAFPLF